MENFTRTSFGLMIAYVVPGFLGLFALSFSDLRIKSYIEKNFLTGNELLMTLICLSTVLFIGLVVNAFNYLLLQRIVFSKIKPPPTTIPSNPNDAHVQLIVSTLDENMRYAQFYGNVFLLIPLLEYHYLIRTDIPNFWDTILVLFWFFILEWVLLLNAKESYRRYVSRLTELSKEV